MAPPAAAAPVRDAAAAEFRRAAEGDGAAFAGFLARFEGRLLAIVRGFVPPADAEDVFQEVCLRLVAKGRLYDPTRPLAPWIDEVARNVARGWLRARARAARDLSAGDPDDLAAPEGDGGDPWIRDAVWSYVAARPAPERQALELVFGRGLTQRDTAARLGVPAGTVAGWLARAVTTLRGKLGGMR